MQQYTLAIVIPTWNCEEYISEMLDSILANTFKDYKVFVVDDHSTDKTQGILKQYHERDKRIELHIRNREPKGAQTCRNIGFELSEGAKYVIWFDADDIVAPYCFEQRVTYMEKHPELDFAIFPAKYFQEHPFDHIHYVWGYDFLGDPIKCFLHRTLTMVGWTNIYKRQTIEEKQLLWDTKVLSLQDADWNVQAILNNCTFEYASKEEVSVDYFYRVVPTGIASKIRTKSHYLSHIYHINKFINSLSDKQLIKYHSDIRSCLWALAGIVINDPNSFNKFLKITWFKQNRPFYIKMVLFKYLKKGHYKLFRCDAVHFESIQKEWEEFKITKYHDMTKHAVVSIQISVNGHRWSYPNNPC